MIFLAILTSFPQWSKAIKMQRRVWKQRSELKFEGVKAELGI